MKADFVMLDCSRTATGWILTADHTGAGAVRAEAASNIHDAVTSSLYPDYGMRFHNDFICGFYFYLPVIFYDICICSLVIFHGRSGVSTRVCGMH